MRRCKITIARGMALLSLSLSLSLSLLLLGCGGRESGAVGSAASGNRAILQTSAPANRTTAMSKQTADPQSDAPDKIVKSDAQWRQELTPEQYHILREGGTEPAFQNKYWDNKKPGTYVCAACGEPLYSSKTKFHSGTGWPSFYEPIKPQNVEEKTDTTLGMMRTEVKCARCGGHLGHVFHDGPQPTGLRYCMDSAALQFVPEKDANEADAANGAGDANDAPREENQQAAK